MSTSWFWALLVLTLTFMVLTCLYALICLAEEDGE